MTPAWTHIKVLSLLFGIGLMCLCLLAVSVMVGYWYAGPNTFGFMAAEVGGQKKPLRKYEKVFFPSALGPVSKFSFLCVLQCILLFIKSLHVITR